MIFVLLQQKPTGVQKLKSLPICIDSGNFYVYYKDGYPTLGVRTQISHGYKDEQELTYEIKNWLNEAYDKHSSMVDDLQKNYPNVVVFDNNISMI